MPNDAIGILPIGTGASTTGITIGRSGILTDFPSGSTVDFTSATVTGLIASSSQLKALHVAASAVGGAYTIGDEALLMVTADNPITVTLPAISAANRGRIILVKRVAGTITNAITIAASGGNTFQNATASLSLALVLYASTTLFSDGLDVGGGGGIWLTLATT